MKLSECISASSIEEMERDWPGGINFKNKSRFLGFSHDGIGGQPDIVVPMEMVMSDEWGATFRPLDKNTIEAIGGLFAELGSNPTAHQIHEKGIDHPCRETCSGWRQGFERGLFEAEEKIRTLKEICQRFADGSKSKRTKIIVEIFGRYFIEPTKRSDE